MKLIISGLVTLLTLGMSASAQMILGPGGLFVRNGSDFSFEGLQFVADGDQTVENTTYTLSNTAIVGINGVSISKVIELSVSRAFTGTFNLLYDEGQLNGNNEPLLKFAVRPGVTWATMESSTVNGGTNIVQYNTGGALTSDRFTATVTNVSLPLVKYSFTAGVTSSNVQLQWLVDQNDFYKGYQLEESNNGATWDPVTYITALPTAKQLYTYSDAALSFDKKFYRLRLDPKIGQSSYSEVITVTTAMKMKKTLMIAEKGQLAINFLQGAVPDQVLLVDNTGKTIYRSQQKQSQYLISNLRTGVYIVRYELKGQSFIEKIMVK